MKVRDVVKRLKADGWVSIGTVGSHEHFTHPSRPKKITVPSGHGQNRDLTPGTLRSIEKDAGWR